jgi:hypothetical protein
MLQRKSRGQGVKDLQKHLNQGLKQKLEVDGKFGPLTQKAVKRFQRDNQLTVDGKVGPETMAALNKGIQPKVEAPKVSAPKVEAPKVEAPKVAAPKVEAPKVAAPKVEAPKVEAPKVEAPKVEAPKVEAPKAEAPKVEAPKAEAPKVEAPKVEAPKAEAPKVEAPKVEAPKVEAPKGASGLPQLADKKLTTQEKFDHYKAMVEAAGGKVDSNRPTVLGLRGLGVDGQRHDSGKNTGSGDDTFVVLGRDKKGNPTVTELKGSTHAAVKKGSVAGGVAQLRPGNYEATRRHDYKGREAWALNGGGNVPVYRDRNRDGMISDAEKAHAVANKTQGDGILFHRDRGVSIGCQVLPDDVLGRLTQAVGGGNFRYTLLDANRPQ